MSGETEQRIIARKHKKPRSNASEARIYSFVDQAVTRVCQAQWYKRHFNNLARTIVGAALTRSCEEDYFKLCWLPQTGRFTIQRLTSYQFTTHIGIDFAGLLYVKTKNSEDERKQSQKVYVCLFTGASTYAVHLELPGALSVKSFLLPFRRLTITSDNAKTFRPTSQDTRRIA